jgi:cytochrome bd ubiquinol oxidase subunit II
MTLDLALIWAGLIAVAVLLYVVLDGFDLGLGILFPFARSPRDRDVMMNTVAPVWDGNETWLVLGGGGLFAAFPLAYAIILPATYPLIIAMLLGLVFRGVAFEFRWRDQAHRKYWDAAFFGGSLVAALTQGMTLGAILQGIAVADRAYAGSWWDWLTPYTLLTGLGVVAGYALLGACWLIWKLDGSAQDHAYKVAKRAMLATLIMLGAVSLYTPLLDTEYWRRWFEAPGIYFASQVPLLTAIIAVVLYRSLAKRREVAPFWLALGLFLLGMVGLGVSLWPYVVPDTVTIWDAAAPERSQVFMLVGVAITMPLIIAYTGWAYWVFRGKVGTEGYH